MKIREDIQDLSNAPTPPTDARKNIKMKTPTKDKSSMPDEVGIVAFKDGSYDCYPDLADVPPSTSYTRTATINAQLDDAEKLCKKIMDLYPNQDIDHVDFRVQVTKWAEGFLERHKTPAENFQPTGESQKG